ncbi:TIGR03619 family F420-dependent LLM class oxidoreductase [Nocardioides sp. zg-DK7169]|uniref:TIGR03619 family F420-dependent LLM class oxidoreductase n=1 Tax=Nocardioides sp. zg-DK7169 TaxID=2736600 RepID=UPI001557424A|nr:TIGR03619 family F420-dependent LLM class oxidoreductase [Nocardioides sp. zg-DK7169]NPC98677.1 TIGR03619 family F420-dependent LLM class oxidoreductase [Nocardioides sp. zg-DK7169]
MQIGITSPVLTANPGAHAAWEADAGIEELAQIARTADTLGLHHMTCSEHVAVPVEVAEQRGATYWDPLATFGYLAAQTTQLRLMTQVLVIGYHHPLAIAKRYGTLDRISNGRLILGIGVGSLEEEFDLLDATFEGRGAIADDALAALRASLGRSQPEYDGTHYRFSGFVVEPHAVQERVPLVIGGRTARSLRRAVELGDGWVPFGLSLEQLSGMLSARELPEDFQVYFSPGRMLDPIGDPEDTATRLRRVREAGATVVTTSVEATGAAHYCDQLEALAAIATQID